MSGNGSHLSELGRQVGEDAKDFASSVSTLADEVQQAARRSLMQQPYVVLGAAVGVGYVLGGGLSSRLTSIAVAVGSRMLLRTVVDQLMTSRSESSPAGTERH